jgi:hypothetical protein
MTAEWANEAVFRYRHACAKREHPGLPGFWFQNRNELTLDSRAPPGAQE